MPNAATLPDSEAAGHWTLVVRRAARLSIVAALGALLAGCMLFRLHRDLNRIETYGWIEGQASAADPSLPLIVVLYSEPSVTPSIEPGLQIVDFFVLPRAGRYFFVAPAGTYRIAAFEDRNRDLTYQPGVEPAGYYGESRSPDVKTAPTGVVLDSGAHIRDVNVAIARESQWKIPFAVGPLDPHKRAIPDLPDVHLGTVAEIDDARFSDENGNLGLWQPAEFVFKVGAGVYFADKYDPDKIPVLFVHGAGGHPGNFKYLAAHLDRHRFQPWFAYYPSGVGLDAASRSLLRWLATLQVQYGFSKMVLVAHSMGGLVTAAAINHAIEDPTATRLVRVPVFVTISTPWNGQASAASGVERAPVVVPSWHDMAPGSPFLSSLVRPLPPECSHYLFFSYQGSTPFIREASDGVVAVASELHLPIQRRAKRMLGFSEDHVSILRSSEVSTELNGILAEAAGS